MMTPLRIFVSFTHRNRIGLEKELTVQLLSDLRNVGVEVVAEEQILSEAGFLVLLERELPRCQWFLLIQTSESIRSLRTQLAMNHALEHVRLQKMEGILRIVCPSSEAESEPLRWSETRAYSFNGDYPRLRDKILLDLDLLHIQDVVSRYMNMSVARELLRTGVRDAKTPRSLSDEDTIIAFAKQSDVAIGNDRPVPLAKSSTVPAFFARLWKREPETAQSDRPTSRPVLQGDRPVPLSNQKKSLLLLSRVLLIALVLLVVVVTASSLFLIAKR